MNNTFARIKVLTKQLFLPVQKYRYTVLYFLVCLSIGLSYGSMVFADNLCVPIGTKIAYSSIFAISFLVYTLQLVPLGHFRLNNLLRPPNPIAMPYTVAVIFGGAAFSSFECVNKDLTQLLLIIFVVSALIFVLLKSVQFLSRSPDA